ncbi:hypothetical protein COMNV_00764 [Commensalibacter sp. Nvir]|uniref:kinase inhibitor n=1 Tax=Commensalibacter sp. Nvir TaxID=3069817 RepID=UPI002D28454E|nr:hypothetical protein COMNV_00764 [Commensalibacter sp. Nvir]
MFKLLSHSFKEGDEMPKKHRFNGMGHDGNNISPSLYWEDAPTETKSFVLTLYDPDAPTGSGWWHWVVVNIPATVSYLEENASVKSMPEGCIQVRNDFSFYKYGGAAPPPGKKHHYIFTVHALNVEKLDVNKDVSPAFVGFNVHNDCLGSAQLTCVFEKK